MIKAGWRRGFLAVSFGIVLGVSGVTAQAAIAAPSGVQGEGGYSEGRPCGDCYYGERRPCGEQRPCEYRRERPARCDACYEGDGPCGDRRPEPRACGDCYDRQPRCQDCDRQGARDDDDANDYDRKEKRRSSLHELLRKIFD